MDLLAIFPHWNALLNATSGVFLLIGFYFIRSAQIPRHRLAMKRSLAQAQVQTPAWARQRWWEL